MKGSTMSSAPSEYRLLQVFLHMDRKSNPAVHEVSWSPTTGHLHCTCEGRRCRHVKYVQSFMAGNGGRYTIHESESEPFDTDRAGDVEYLRGYVLRHAPVAVI